MKRWNILYVLGPVVFGILGASASAPDLFPSLKQDATQGEVTLRGYGKLAGTSWRDDKGGSLLEISCEDEAKAKLVQAKYFSDLQVLPGVTPSAIKVGGVTISAMVVQGQGSIAALQRGNKVIILAAPPNAEMGNFFEKTFGKTPRDLNSTAQVEVPMYMSRWDKYGFRFYYSYPWATPTNCPGAKNNDLIPQTSRYDNLQDFAFAADHDHAGLVFWLDPELTLDTAEGLTNETNIDYAIQASAVSKLPIGINLMVLKAPLWLFNRYPEQFAGKMPQILGDGIGNRQPFRRWTGKISGAATSLLDADLGMCQEIVRRYAAMPNVVSFLEPHDELRNIAGNILMEYGPLADAKFRECLENKYKTLTALNAAWGTRYGSWDELHVPELASFAGWGPDALDLTGTWKIGYETSVDGASYTYLDSKLAKQLRGKALETKGAPEEWFEENFDDSAWPAITAPGSDLASIRPSIPAVYRRTFDVPKDWLKKHPNTWLYLWDLNEAESDSVKVVINGEVVAEDPVEGFGHGHWGGYNVGRILREGRNQISIRLPKGQLGYRVYLSAFQPGQYPNLAGNLNAQWVDFNDWSCWLVADSVRRGVEMIRQVDPNRPIDVMSPDYYADGVMKLGKAYGVNFKNTGHMAGFWGDFLPAVMRGAGLPFSVEPGHPAKDLAEFKKQIGLWCTEGIQGIDYFQHIGFVMWNSKLREHFEKNYPLLTLVGKYHAPTAEIAALYSSRTRALNEFPWNNDPNANLDCSYYAWNVRANLRGLYESDGLTDSSFETGDAAKYRVIIDTNTCVMDEKMLVEIEQYVRNGGTFVTFVQTGRNSPTKPNAWPIEKLAGYHVAGIDPLDKNGEPLKTRSLKPASGQTIFSESWNKANGLSLKKVLPDAKDLMLWEDGSVAIGMRPLGKGSIIQIGCKFAGAHMPNRLQATMKKNLADPLTQLLTRLLAWRGVAPVPARFEPTDTQTILRHYVSNNGLYDVWALFNQSDREAAVGAIEFEGAVDPAWAQAVSDGGRIAITARKLPVTLEPAETKIYLTPRNAIARAPVEWFNLQRGWWQGTDPVSAQSLPVAPHKNSLDLSRDWAFKPLVASEDGTAYAAAGVNDTDWEKMPLGVWNLRPNRQDIHDAILRKTFVVPETWTNGEIDLWLQSGQKATFADQGRVWLDGRLIRDWSAGGLTQINPDNVLAAGSTHTLAVEIKGEGTLNGSRGAAWLWYWPKPISTLDLAGQWEASKDLLRYDQLLSLPGAYDAFSFRRTITIPKEAKGRNVVLDIESEGDLVGIVFNGHYFSRAASDPRFQFNITPWVKFGEPNEIECIVENGAHAGTVRSIRLDFYDAGVYP